MLSQGCAWHHFCLTHTHGTSQKCIQSAPEKLQPWGLPSPAQEICSHRYYFYHFPSTYVEYPLLLSPFLPSQHRPVPPSLPQHHPQALSCPNTPSSLCLLPGQTFPGSMIAPTCCSSLSLCAPPVSPLRQGLVYRSFRCNFYFMNKRKDLVNQRRGKKDTGALPLLKHARRAKA